MTQAELDAAAQYLSGLFRQVFAAEQANAMTEDIKGIALIERLAWAGLVHETNALADKKTPRRKPPAPDGHYYFVD